MELEVISHTWNKYLEAILVHKQIFQTVQYPLDSKWVQGSVAQLEISADS